MTEERTRDIGVGPMEDIRLAPEWRQPPIYRPPSMPLVGSEPTAPLLEQEAQLDGMLDGIRALALKALASALILLASVGIIIALVVVVWRWFKRGLNSMKDALLGQFSYMYGWLDEFSPSPTEEERLVKEETLRARVIGLWTRSLPTLALPSFLAQLDWLDGIILIAVVVLATVGFKLASSSLALSARRVIQSWRGVQFEAMRPGSAFTKADIPPNQVQIKIPGLLTDSHQGYGIRVGDYLVTPAHVVQGHREVLLSTAMGKYLVEVNAIRSRMADDLVYLFIGPNVFSQLGVAVTRFQKNFVASFATCAGEAGMSTGRISKSVLRGKLIYDGSTVPGMSGAAYMIQGATVGVHQGVAGAINLGYSGDLIRVEMRHLTRGEALSGTSPGSGDSSAARPRFTTTWKFEDLEQSVASRYAEDNWHGYEDEDEDFYTRQLNFENSKPVPRVTITPGDGVFQVATTSVSGQSPDEIQVVSDIIPAELVDKMSALVGANLINRIKVLELQVKQLQDVVHPPVKAGPSSSQAPPPSADEKLGCGKCGAQVAAEKMAIHIQNSHPPAFPCNQCDVVCRNKDRLHRHTLTSHPEVVGESAFAEDTGSAGKLIKTGKPFLEKTASKKKKKKNSSLSSSSSDLTKAFQLMAASLSEMQAFQKNLPKLLKDSLKG